jgi:predicted GNAT family N-acyltransferase
MMLAAKEALGMLTMEHWYGDDPRLATVLEVRKEVFVEEQAVPLDEELDGKDPTTFHVLARWDGEPVGTARLFAGEPAKIGRVAVRLPYRGKAIGAALMQAAEAVAREQGSRTCGLDAQVSAIPFYERLGYVVDGPEFLDAGIPHRHMSKSLVTAEA